ncbi:MAG: glycosyltransferase family 39 protein [Actinomycetota bacterium]|nr:glycosyltransferase family 39 protein [Actinomycetota bacterium]
MRKGRRRLGEFLVVALLLCLLFFQVFFSAIMKSPVYDEVVHLPVGYSYLKTYTYWLELTTPPLVKLVAAFPLLFLDLNFSTDSSAWRERNHLIFGHGFLYAANKNADQIVLFGRISIILLSLVLGFFVFWWAKGLYGVRAGLFALFLYTFEPNILAHSGLATIDLGVACFIFIATYFFWRFWREPSWRNLVLAGVTFGLAQTSKFSAILLFPAYIVLILFLAFTSKELTIPSLFSRSAGDDKGVTKKGKFRALFVPLVLIFLIGFTVIFLIYGCQFRPLVTPQEPMGEHFQAFVQRITRGKPIFAGIVQFCLEKVPLPAGSWFRGLITQVGHSRYGHAAFLAGRYSTSGWWYYHFVAFLIKTPIALLILVALAVVFWKRIRSKNFLNEWFLLVPIAVFFLFSALGRISIGLRYILPIYPFLFVFVSKLVSLPANAPPSVGQAGVRVKKQTLFRLSLILLCSWYLFSSLSIYPHYLAYFNEFAGGPNNGYKYLVDSNLDWGQDLKGLAKYVRGKGIEKIKLSYFGTANPDYYDFPYKLMSDYEMHHRVPGIYAISATNLQNALVKDKTRFAWLKKYEPVDKIGYSIFIYDVK